MTRIFTILFIVTCVSGCAELGASPDTGSTDFVQGGGAGSRGQSDEENQPGDRLPDQGVVEAIDSGAHFMEEEPAVDAGVMDPRDASSDDSGLQDSGGSPQDASDDDGTGCDDDLDCPEGERCLGDVCGVVADPVCGDGHLDQGEECDDGNDRAGDGCAADCIREPIGPVCGDGVLEGQEVCDDGNNDHHDGCSADCSERVVRDVLMRCGSSARDVSEFIPEGAQLQVVESCEPGPNTQALLVTRSGFAHLDPDRLRTYLEQGGVVITEFSTSAAVFNMAFDIHIPRGAMRGACIDSINPAVRLNLEDPFWLANGHVPASGQDTGCGFDVSHFPGISPLGGWDEASVSLAYRDLGRGRLWLVESDWQDREYPFNQASEDLMGHMILTRGVGSFCGDGAVDVGEICDDDNNLNGDGCSANCRAEDGGPICGDGVVTHHEVCDDGNNANGDDCSADCILIGQPEVRDVLMQCGVSQRDVNVFVHDAIRLQYVAGCEPDADTQALIVTRTGAEQIDGPHLRDYLDNGGVVITEYSVSDEVYNLAFEGDVEQGSFEGDCGDNVNPAVRSGSDQGFWSANADIPGLDGLSGCGHDLSHFPGITSLGGWSDDTVSLAYRDLGAGRVWFVEADWQDNQRDFESSSVSLMQRMILNRVSSCLGDGCDQDQRGHGDRGPGQGGEGDDLIRFLRIEGGRAAIGSHVSPREQPIHEIHVPTFEMAQTEVTVGQYRVCVEAGACTRPSCRFDRSPGDREDHPVVCVDWSQAKTFADFVDARLPTEAEWDYAARNGGQDIVYPWGDEIPECFSNHLNFDGCIGDTTPVCRYPGGSTDHGLCDMAGNVFEWVEDDWHPSYIDAPVDGSPRVNLPRAMHRVSRGGGWRGAANGVRAAHRQRSLASSVIDNRGFRLARDVQ